MERSSSETWPGGADMAAGEGREMGRWSGESWGRCEPAWDGIYWCVLCCCVLVELRATKAVWIEESDEDANGFSSSSAALSSRLLRTTGGYHQMAKDHDHDGVPLDSYPPAPPASRSDPSPNAIRTDYPSDEPTDDEELLHWAAGASGDTRPSDPAALRLLGDDGSPQTGSELSSSSKSSRAGTYTTDAGERSGSSGRTRRTRGTVSAAREFLDRNQGASSSYNCSHLPSTHPRDCVRLPVHRIVTGFLCHHQCTGQNIAGTSSCPRMGNYRAQDVSYLARMYIVYVAVIYYDTVHC